MIKKINLRKNILACVLSGVMLFSAILPINAEAVRTDKETYVVWDSGVKYTISVVQGNEGKQITVHTDDSKDYVVQKISNDGDTLKIVNYEYETTTYAGNDRFSKEVEQYNLDELQNEAYVTSKAVTYNAKKKGGLGSDGYYYQYGYSGKQTYCKVGNSSKSNAVRIDNSASKESKCDLYADYLDTSRNYYSKACAYSAASGFGIGIIAGLVIANTAFPPSVIVTIVIAACGGGSSIIACVNALIDSNTYSTKAKNQFTKVIVL